MDPLRAGYSVKKRKRPAAKTSLSWSQRGWLLFYLCLAQWLAVVVLCFFRRGEIVTMYYTPVLSALRRLTPASLLNHPTPQAGMLWVILCMLVYGVILTAACHFLIRHTPPSPPRRSQV